MAEQLLSSKTPEQIAAEQEALKASVATTNLSERPLNNIDTNSNYAADLAAQQQRAVQNKALDSAANTLSSPTATPEAKQSAQNMFDQRTQSVLQSRPDLQTLAANKGVDYRVPQPSWQDSSIRDVSREQAMAKKLGGSPTSDQEFDMMMKATYSPRELEQMGFTPSQAAAVSGAMSGGGVGSGQAGSAAAFNPEMLKAQGYTDEQIAALKEKGDAANAAQSGLNATPQPTNTMLGALQQALKIKSGVGNQETGNSQLYKEAGIQTTGAGGYGALAQSLSQRRAEMGQTYDSYANLVQSVGGQMNDTYKNALENYKATMATYEAATAKVDKINEEARSYEKQLDLMKRQAELSKESFLFQKDYEAKIAKDKPDYQFISETDNQPAGYFDKNTGAFTPLTVGGDSYGGTTNNYSSYLGDGATSNGEAYTYSKPVPHGSANVEVTQSNPNLIDVYKNGYQKAAGPSGLGGQCAYEAQQWVDFNGKGWKVGNTIQEKAKSFANYAKQGLGFYKGQGEPEVGNAVFSNDDPKYGHYWVINAKTADGKLVASEFNRAGSRVFSNNRIVDPNDKSIIGFLKTTPKSQYQVDKEETAAANIKKAGEGIKNILKGKVQGGLLDLIGAGTMVAKDAMVSVGKGVSDKKAQIAAKAKIDAGIKAGILDESGKPFSPDRMAVRSGAFTDTMLNQKYTELKKAVQKGYEPSEALDVFQQDLIYGQKKAQELASKQKLDEKLAQPMNENQSKAIGFAVSARQAEGFMPLNGSDKSLATLNNWFTRAGKTDDIVSDKINEIKDPVAQQIVQSEMQWVANVLRGESGAAISLGEYKNAGLTYFPRPGDSETVLQRKKAARDQKVQNLLVQGGPQGAQYWKNLGYSLPSAVAKQYGLSTESAANDEDLYSSIGGGVSDEDLWNSLN